MTGSCERGNERSISIKSGISWLVEGLLASQRRKLRLELMCSISNRLSRQFLIKEGSSYVLF
jgi:hypothetical protein